MIRSIKANAVRRIWDVLEALPGGRFYTSARGVPLAVFGDKSVCWFAKNQHYRIFHGFGMSGLQKRFDFPDISGVIGHFDESGVAEPIAVPSLER